MVVVVAGIGVVVLRASDLPISFMKKTCILALNDKDFSVVVVIGTSVVVVGMNDAWACGTSPKRQFKTLSVSVMDVPFTTTVKLKEVEDSQTTGDLLSNVPFVQ